jgi:hypothetical protein
LGVEDVTTPEAKSREVILQGANGTPVADLIVGQLAGGGGGAEGATFVRIANDPQAWLVRGTLNPSMEPRDWVDRTLIAIPAADIRQVRIAQADGSTLTAVRESDDNSPFKLAELPKGGRLTRPDAAESLVSPFSDLSFEDIVPAKEAAFPADKTMRVTITRTGGGVIAFEVADNDGMRWLRFAGGAPASLPPVGSDMAFRVPAWKVSPLERKLSELVETQSGS